METYYLVESLRRSPPPAATGWRGDGASVELLSGRTESIPYSLGRETHDGPHLGESRRRPAQKMAATGRQPCFPYERRVSSSMWLPTRKATYLLLGPYVGSSLVLFCRLLEPFWLDSESCQLRFFLGCRATQLRLCGCQLGPSLESGCICDIAVSVGGYT
jgi:hypothetical protein